MTYYTRAAWGAAAPLRGLAALSRSRVRFWTVHYDGAGAIGLREPRGLMRAFQRHHQKTRKWADIGYNSAAFQTGDRAEGRGPYVGGHLRNDQNAESWGVIAAIGNGEKPRAALLVALREDFWAANAWAGKTLVERGHTEWPQANKPCPGDDLMRWLANGGHYMDETTARQLQAHLGVPVDGALGHASRTALQRWLGVTADGVWGTGTTTALQRRIGHPATGVWTGTTTGMLAAWLTQDTPQPNNPDSEEELDMNEAQLAAIVRPIIREEVAGLLGIPVDVSGGEGVDRGWVAPAAKGLAAAAELEKVTLLTGQVIRTDDLLALIAAKLGVEGATPDAYADALGEV